MRKVLILGGSYFIGRRITEQCLEDGWEVSLLNRGSKSWTCLLYTSRNLKNEIESVLEKAKNYFYYAEIYLAFKVIINYYLDASYPTNDESDQLYLNSFILDSKVEELISNILFDHYYYKVMNMVIAVSYTHLDVYKRQP